MYGNSGCKTNAIFNYSMIHGYDKRRTFLQTVHDAQSTLSVRTLNILYRVTHLNERQK